MNGCVRERSENILSEDKEMKKQRGREAQKLSKKQIMKTFLDGSKIRSLWCYQWNEGETKKTKRLKSTVLDRNTLHPPSSHNLYACCLSVSLLGVMRIILDVFTYSLQMFLFNSYSHICRRTRKGTQRQVLQNTWQEPLTHRKKLSFIRETSRSEVLAASKCSSCLNTHFLFVTAFRRHDMMC